MHDLALQGDTGNAHLQLMYEDGVITGPTMRLGPPTGVSGH